MAPLLFSLDVNMKKKQFLKIDWKDKLKEWSVVLVAIILGYIAYPRFSTTRIEAEAVIVDKVAGYTYYKIGDKITDLKIDDHHAVGEKTTISIKVKDHPKYKDDGNVKRDKWFIVGFLVLSIIVLPIIRSLSEYDREIKIINHLMFPCMLCAVIDLIVYLI